MKNLLKEKNVNISKILDDLTDNYNKTNNNSKNNFLDKSTEKNKKIDKFSSFESSIYFRMMNTY
jgi:hypothetical protein